MSKATRWVRDAGQPPQAGGRDGGVDDRVRHRAGLVDQQDDLPLIDVPAGAGEEVRRLDVEPPVLGPVVAEVVADGAPDVEVACLPEPAGPPRPRPGERQPHLGRQPLDQLADHRLDHAPGQPQHVRVHQVLGAEHRLEQVGVRLDPLPARRGR